MVQPAEEDGQKGEDPSPGNMAQLELSCGALLSRLAKDRRWQQYPAVSIQKGHYVNAEFGLA
jgi:hypothetical protein